MCAMFPGVFALCLLCAVHSCLFMDRRKEFLRQRSDYIELFNKNHRHLTAQNHGRGGDTDKATPTDKASICLAYKNVKASIESLMASFNEFERSNLLGAAVRVAFHDSAEVDMTNPSDLNGPDGCLSSSVLNRGLVEPTSFVVTVLDPIWFNNSQLIGLADFWVMVGKIAIELSDPTHNIAINYQFGRRQNTVCNTGVGRLPDATLGNSELFRVFVKQMQLTIQDGVTLMGAHTVGHVHINSSGFGFPGDIAKNVKLNAWDDTPAVFDNLYFINLQNQNWHNELSSVPFQSQWYNVLPGGITRINVMLNSDMTMSFDANVCNGIGIFGQICGPTAINDTLPGCDPEGRDQTPKTRSTVMQYINDNQLFLDQFSLAYTKMVCVGYGVPAFVDGATSTGKLGTLTHIDLDTC